MQSLAAAGEASNLRAVGATAKQSLARQAAEADAATAQEAVAALADEVQVCSTEGSAPAKR